MHSSSGGGDDDSLCKGYERFSEGSGGGVGGGL